eukprot:gene4391-3193_t
MSAVPIESMVEQWLAWDKNPETRRAIEKLWEEKNESELTRLLGSRMSFGTAGLRAAMGPGNSQMNSLTIVQTAQGLLHYLKSQFSPEALRERGVVIGFDGRHHSDEFAHITASVMKAGGVKTYCYKNVSPTPFVPFAILHYHCVAGVMVTASHNPKTDNGYKVYWENGAQIVPPHDTGISRAIELNLEPLPDSWQPYNGDISPDDEIFELYFSSLKASYVPLGQGGTRRFVYSAMHGVGARPTLHSLQAIAGVPADRVAVVKEQEEPDPEFRTVEFPNPEEGKNSLDLSLRLGTAQNCHIILANDPDADRLAVAERQPDGSWRLFNGNEVGALLGWWAIFHAKKRGDDLSTCVLLSSTVSSCVLNTMAKKDGLQFIDTLTGFKWIGTISQTLEAEKKGKVLFAFEEAIGFMWGTRVFDKDGVTAAAIVADMANYLEVQEGLSLTQKLRSIYQAYGFHFSSNSYVKCYDAAKKAKMFERIQTMNGGSYPSSIAGAGVLHVRDLATGLDTRHADRKASLPVSKSSPLITFYLDNNVVLSVRGSGTEPKIKWYAECVTTDETNGQAALAEFTRRAVEELIQPDENGFEHYIFIYIYVFLVVYSLRWTYLYLSPLQSWDDTNERRTKTFIIQLVFSGDDAPFLVSLPPVPGPLYSTRATLCLMPRPSLSSTAGALSRLPFAVSFFFFCRAAITTENKANTDSSTPRDPSMKTNKRKVIKQKKKEEIHNFLVYVAPSRLHGCRPMTPVLRWSAFTAGKLPCFYKPSPSLLLSFLPLLSVSLV